ncbi:MAG: cyclohexa-1,5-dienecarbonyl-CoA hydratase [Gammaproteobacteria bacterium]
MSELPLKVQLDRAGRLLRLSLARPKKNIVDAAMIAALQSALDEHRESTDLAAVLIDAEGPNFSFGASVEEHLPEHCERMIKAIHHLVLTLIGYPVPVLVAVQGFCLGGGMEVASAGNLIFSAPDAQFGQPEIQLAVFAPAASCLLPERIGRAQAEDLLFSGRAIDTQEALRIGLINRIADDPRQAALEYIDEQLLPRSSCAMRHAVWAARTDLVERVRDKIAKVEKRYLEDLMSSHDPVEGLRAFIDKRPPHWENR